MISPSMSRPAAAVTHRTPANTAYARGALGADIRRGRLIAVEGLDGTGKTTLSRQLATTLQAEWSTTPGIDIRHGGLRELADMAFTDPQARQLFYAAAVVQESARIAELLQQGRTVVVDRWWLTTWAYGQLRGDGLDLWAVEALVLPADVTLWVELPESERRRRLLARGMTAADRQTLQTGTAARLKRLYRQGLGRPIAGQVVRLDVAGADAEAVCALAVAGIETAQEFVDGAVRNCASASS
jgi:dTMP kinase